MAMSAVWMKVVPWLELRNAFPLWIDFYENTFAPWLTLNNTIEVFESRCKIASDLRFTLAVQRNAKQCICSYLLFEIGFLQFHLNQTLRINCQVLWCRSKIFHYLLLSSACLRSTAFVPGQISKQWHRHVKMKLEFLITPLSWKSERDRQFVIEV